MVTNSVINCLYCDIEADIHAKLHKYIYNSLFMDLNVSILTFQVILTNIRDIVSQKNDSQKLAFQNIILFHSSFYNFHKMSESGNYSLDVL